MYDPFDPKTWGSTADKSAVEKRDEGIDRVSSKYDDLVEAAKVVAMRIYTERGRVTSVEIVTEMESDPRYAERMRSTAQERRWLGAVFRKGTGWVRVGWESKGSHARPVAIWQR
jgi:hypothetical protein